jgi:hypothetical protein
MYANDTPAKNPKIIQVHELLKTALCRENDRVQDGLQELPNGSVHGLGTVPQPVPKTTRRINGDAFRAINAPPQTLNVHKFPFMEMREMRDEITPKWMSRVRREARLNLV